MIQGVSHIAIAVRSLEEAIPFYRDALGLPLEGVEEVPDQRVRVAFLTAGSTRVELLEATSEDSPISRFVRERGGGLHHLAFQTDHLEEEIGRLVDRGVRMIDTTPRPGAHHTRIAFLHPKGALGSLLELTEEAPAPQGPIQGGPPPSGPSEG